MLFFGMFSVAPSPPWKRLNSAIFRSFCYFSVFFPLPPPRNFSADALGYKHVYISTDYPIIPTTDIRHQFR